MNGGGQAQEGQSIRRLAGRWYLLAYILTLLAPFTPSQLAPASLDAWRGQSHILQRRFRKHPDKYLADRQMRLIQLDLPP